MIGATRVGVVVALAIAMVACSPAGDEAPAATPATGGSAAPGGQAAVVDDGSQPNVVRVAVGSADHTTLVAALQAAGLVDALANVGPFTVFAPTNAAFDKLPAGTVETLVKPENKATLVNILYHHVTTSALDLGLFKEGQSLNMVGGPAVVITRKDGDTFVDGAKVLGSVRASNGWVHVIDAVLVPPAK
ncbi:MAG: fasciclin domain-containing protein [Gemmatimonadota bacterium]|nr:fasciclin domain-containing protein [Gemmatimonadota bacterium]